ncbi:MAG: hypothetical protein IJD22_07275 [Clostridia bacterium]|nr:hypothetical protein [Clostridia bacterium]
MIIDIAKLDSIDMARAFVDDCEAEFRASVRGVAQYIAASEDCRAVTLAGPTCSGKTTAASILISALAEMGKKATVISIDDFYYSEDDMARLGICDFEGASAIDTEFFRKTAEQLASFSEAYLPKYDFTLRRRVSLTPHVPESNEIFIFEGIQAIYPEILSCLDSFKRVSLFICVADGVTVGDVSFSPHEMRLMRRTVRDHYHRGTDVENTMILWENVRSNEEKNIFPYVGGENMSINSLIPYEIFMVGKEFLSLSEGYPAFGPRADEVFSLRERLLKIPCRLFTHDMMPEGSLLHEFSE